MPQQHHPHAHNTAEPLVGDEDRTGLTDLKEIGPAADTGERMLRRTAPHLLEMG